MKDRIISMAVYQAVFSAVLRGIAVTADVVPSREEKELWLTSPDRAYSICFPEKWPFPGFSKSISPPGMNHLFFLSDPDSVLGIDIAVAGEKMTPEKYFQLIRKVKAKSEKQRSSLQTIKLKDGSSFTYFSSVETGGKRDDYFIQGIVKKPDAGYYVTITSIRKILYEKNWSKILSALASLRKGASTLGGKKMNISNQKTMDVGADGSVLKILPTWIPRPWGYMTKFGFGPPVHSFDGGV
ncbi:MAG: hypothetical protein AAB359_07265 [Elusimicrobiota bacterium]